jgi:hypothetical protein
MASSNTSNTYMHIISITSVQIKKASYNVFLRFCPSFVAMLDRCVFTTALLYSAHFLDQIPDLLPDLNPIFKKCETKGKSGEKWR